MPTIKRITCECGFIARGATDDELVEVIQKHVKQVHDIDLRREQALAMAQIEP
jgi:predicted small metal-binding protein